MCDKKRNLMENDDLDSSNTEKKLKLDEEKVIIHNLPIKNLSKKAGNAFKSPLAANRTLDTNRYKHAFKSNVDNNQIQNEINRLKKSIEEIDEEISKLEADGYLVDDLDRIIEELHVYNETKDTAQIVLGKLAHIHGITIKEMHKKYDIDIDND